MNGRLRKKKGIYTRFPHKECWSLDVTVAKFVLPRLRVYKKETNGIPGIIAVDYKEEEAKIVWNEILDKMIWSFEQIITDSEEPTIPSILIKNDFLEVNDEEELHEVRKQWWRDLNEYNSRIQEGLDLFAKYFRCLWW